MAEREMEMKTVELVCDACGHRGCVHLSSPVTQTTHSRMPQDKVTEVLCSKCASMRREEDNWTVSLGRETG